MAKLTVVGEVTSPIDRDLSIFRLKPGAADRTDVSRISRRVGMTGDLVAGAFCEDASTHTYTEREGTLQLFRGSGGWKYRDRRRWQVDDGSADLRIDDAAAVAAAREVIETRQLTSMDGLRPLRVTRLHVAHAERGSEKSEERVIDVGVAFERLVDGVPVEGPGGKVVVYLDHERRLTGVDHLVREIEDEHEPVASLRSAEEALDDVRRRYEGPDEGRLEVTGVRLGYFEMGWHHRQEFLQPAYIVFLRLVSADERIRMNSVFAVAAAANSPAAIEPPRRRPPAQDRRQEGST